MLWIDYTMLYGGILGGLIGACVMAFSMARSSRSHMRLLEFYWDTDIKRIHEDIREMEGQVKSIRLSTKSVVNPVPKKQKAFNNNGCKAQ